MLTGSGALLTHVTAVLITDSKHKAHGVCTRRATSKTPITIKYIEGTSYASTSPKANGIMNSQPLSHRGMVFEISTRTMKPQVKRQSWETGRGCVCRNSAPLSPALERPMANGRAIVSGQLPSNCGMILDIRESAPPSEQRIELPSWETGGGCICGAKTSPFPVWSSPMAKNGLVIEPSHPRMSYLNLSAKLQVDQQGWRIWRMFLACTVFLYAPWWSVLCSSFASLTGQWNEQPVLRIRGGCLCCGGGVVTVGANKDNEDDKLEAGQRRQQAEMAETSRSTAPQQLIPLLQPPAPAPTREPKHSNASKRTVSQSRGTPDLGPQRAPNPDRRATAKTLPPHLARPDLVQPPKQSRSRTQSTGPRVARPSLP